MAAETTHRPSRAAKIAAAVGGTICVLIILGAVIYFARRRQVLRRSQQLQATPLKLDETSRDHQPSIPSSSFDWLRPVTSSSLPTGSSGLGGRGEKSREGVPQRPRSAASSSGGWRYLLSPQTVVVKQALLSELRTRVDTLQMEVSQMREEREEGDVVLQQDLPPSYMPL